MKLANEAFHEVRRSEARERKGSAEASVLKGSRWALLKTPENLGPDERVRLSAVADLNARVYRAYLLKEELRAMYRCRPKAASEHLRSWLSWASRSQLALFVRLGRTLRQHREGILAAIRLEDRIPLLLRPSARSTHLKLRRGFFGVVGAAILGEVWMLSPAAIFRAVKERAMRDDDRAR